MEIEYTLNTNESVEFNFDPDSIIEPLRVELNGAGNLSVCSLRFFNGDEQSMKEHKEIIFVVSDHPTQVILTPVTNENVSSYRYAVLKVFKGTIQKEDKITFTISTSQERHKVKSL